jgi:hypothetical protein
MRLEDFFTDNKPIVFFNLHHPPCNGQPGTRGTNNYFI